MKIEDFKIGTRVAHDAFGLGTVVCVNHPGNRITVEFDEENYELHDADYCDDRCTCWYFGNDAANLNDLSIIPKYKLEPKLCCASDYTDAQKLLYKITSNSYTGLTGVKNDDSVDAVTCFIENREEKEKGDNNMEIKNEVLKLYEEREKEKIQRDYDQATDDFIENNELVKKYRSIVVTFKESMDELYKSVENVTSQVIVKKPNCFENNEYLLCIDSLAKEYHEKHLGERYDKEQKLNSLVKEVNAQLSISDNADYQIDVLVRYGILDKKTKKMVD